MGFMFYQTRFLLLVYLSIVGSTSSNKCAPRRNMRIFPAYRCVVENTISSNITPRYRYSCQHECMLLKWCSVINGNLASDSCLLSNGPCIQLVPDNDFHVIYINISKPENCLVWTPGRKSTNPARAHNTCIDNGFTCIVGRFPKKPNLLPGNFADWAVFSVLDNALASEATAGAESLDVQPGCIVNWIRFDGGEPLPEGAVDGGYLDGGGVRQPLYIMSVDVIHLGETCSVYGYYNPATGLGYGEFYGVTTYTHMNLMILLN